MNLKSNNSSISLIDNIDFNHKYKYLIILASMNDYLKLWKITEQNIDEVISY